MAKHYKKKTINKAKLILLTFFIILLIISSMKIINWYKENKENEEISEEISKTITIDEKQNKKEDKYNVDFTELKEKNPDTVAWLKVNGTNIETTVVKSTNNDYYLNHNFKKEYNEAGWIFADYKNKLDGTDKNVVIYGHNRKDGSMFSTLKNTLKEEWYNNEENLNIYFITENEKSIYKVFSIYEIKNEEYYIQTNFKDNEEFTKFLETIKGRSKKDFNIELTAEDDILTLSTCGENNNYRVVLHAKKCK